jgi:hypothetical protein
LGQEQGGRCGLKPKLDPAFAVLNPGGRDQTRIFPQGAGLPSDSGHPPVNYHAYAACCRSGFYREWKAVPEAIHRVLVLLRKDGLNQALHAARKLRERGTRVVISWKESGLPQVARVLATPGLHEKFRAICKEVDGFISSTSQLVPLYEAAGCGRGGFVPTPYPIEEPVWDFSIPLGERRGIFIGTREFGVPSRNHFLAIASIQHLGQPVTVINTEGWTGARLLRAISHDLHVISGKLPYRDYLCLMARHRIVFQLDRSAVPGQVAGDALLCGLPCIGGDGAVDRLAFPDLCGISQNGESAVRIAERLLSDDDFYQEAVARSRELGLEHLSFSKVRRKLLSEEPV